MNIQAEKIELAKLILSTDNPRIIESIKHIFRREKSGDFWDDLTPEQQKEIRKASSEIEKGNSADYETLMAKH